MFCERLRRIYNIPIVPLLFPSFSDAVTVRQGETPPPSTFYLNAGECGFLFISDDCDDGDGDIFPGNPELCDGKDNDCDGEKDEGACCVDSDGDGHYAIDDGCPDGDDWDDAPDTGGSSYPGAPEKCDGKDNDGDGKKEGFVLKVTPNEVAPQMPSSQPQAGGTEALVKLKLTDPPTDICYIHLNVIPAINSGGHDHHDALRPHGKIGGYDNLMATLSGNEEKNIKYTSSEVSGTEDIEAQMVYDGEVVSAPIGSPIKVKIPVLGQMPTGDYYNLTGSYGQAGVTSMHTGNHFAEVSVIGAMQKIAWEYYQLTENKLGINDMSLKWGGLFDIHNNWFAPHKSHRKGADADIDRYVRDSVNNQALYRPCFSDDDLHNTVRLHGTLICECPNGTTNCPWAERTYKHIRFW